MVRVRIGHRQRIAKHGRRFLEGDPVLPAIPRSLARIPLKIRSLILQCCRGSEQSVDNRLVIGGGEGFDEGGELEDFDLGGALGPIVAPADDYVAAGERVAVVAKIAAFKFKFDVHALPSMRGDLALGFAVGEAGLNGFDDVAEFLGNHAEEKHDALFVDRFMAEATEIDGAP
jgi:hypothetical protein